jgi:Uma2 family endonuclease
MRRQKLKTLKDSNNMEYKDIEPKISKFEEIDLNLEYNYANYLKWFFPERVEIIKGKVLKMAPAPNTGHQRVLLELGGLLWQSLKGKVCQPFIAPFDVRLSKFKEDKAIDSVVQPDLCIICDPKKIDEKGCNGAPDMIVEILSPSTAQRDLELKYSLYEENGVKEYWIVQPNDQIVSVFDLEGEKYQLRGIYHRLKTVLLKTIGLEIDLREVFPDNEETEIENFERF